MGVIGAMQNFSNFTWKQALRAKLIHFGQNTAYYKMY